MPKALLAAAGVVFAVVVLAAAFRFLRKPTPEQMIAKHAQKARERGGLIFETTAGVAKLTLLVSNCKVYRLQVKDNRVEEVEVLRTGFLLWFSGCVSQSIRMEDGYIRVELVNRELGAGGGNASGGVYRSRDGNDWEKRTRKGWLPVSEAQN